MTLEEAIDCLSEEASVITGASASYRFRAHKLGIEALKLLKQHPTIRAFLDDKLLPGETKE